MTNITVVDAIMGSGKTKYVMQMMNERAYTQLFEDDARRFVYITPLLDEVRRIIGGCSALDFREPQEEGTKLRSFNRLIAEGHNVASTHALFGLADADTRERLRKGNYTLVIDETLECVREYGDSDDPEDKLTRDDLRGLFKAEYIYTDDTGRVCWNHAKWPEYRGRWEKLRALCDLGALTQVVSEDEDSTGLLVWSLPADFLKLFDRVLICTYLFEGSLMAAHLKANGLSYTVKTLSRDGLLTDPDQTLEREKLAEYRERITVIEDQKLNAIGDPEDKENPLSATWYSRDVKSHGLKIRKVQLNTYGFFTNTAKTPTERNMWTCFRAQRELLKGKRYTKGWVASNMRATNDHRNRTALAFLVNVFMRPMIREHFRRLGVFPDHELYALTQLVQWVWRSSIRVPLAEGGQSITLYLPSRRMRELFLRWLAGEFVVSGAEDDAEQHAEAA